nr:uncharacterized protein LOC113827273 [Penaeus vannamei]
MAGIKEGKFLLLGGTYEAQLTLQRGANTLSELNANGNNFPFAKQQSELKLRDEFPIGDQILHSRSTGPSDSPFPFHKSVRFPFRRDPSDSPFPFHRSVRFPIPVPQIRQIPHSRSTGPSFPFRQIPIPVPTVRQIPPFRHSFRFPKSDSHSRPRDSVRFPFPFHRSVRFPIPFHTSSDSPIPVPEIPSDSHSRSQIRQIFHSVPQVVRFPIPVPQVRQIPHSRSRDSVRFPIPVPGQIFDSPFPTSVRFPIPHRVPRFPIPDSEIRQIPIPVSSFLFLFTGPSDFPFPFHRSVRFSIPVPTGPSDFHSRSDPSDSPFPVHRSVDSPFPHRSVRFPIPVPTDPSDPHSRSQSVRFPFRSTGPSDSPFPFQRSVRFPIPVPSPRFPFPFQIQIPHSIPEIPSGPTGPSRFRFPFPDSPVRIRQILHPSDSYSRQIPHSRSTVLLLG